jgi:hypothetical protein
MVAAGEIGEEAFAFRRTGSLLIDMRSAPISRRRTAHPRRRPRPTKTPLPCSINRDSQPAAFAGHRHPFSRGISGSWLVLGSL